MNIYIQTSPSYRRSVLGVHSKDWCWSWNFNTLATWWEELTHWKRSWGWQRLRAGREGNDRGWDVWMTSATRWTWVWVNSRCWWWTGRPGVLRFMGSQRVRHDWGTELIWTDISLLLLYIFIYIDYYYYYFLICHNFYCNVAIFVRVGSLISKSMFHLRLFRKEIAIMTDTQNIFITW